MLYNVFTLKTNSYFLKLYKFIKETWFLYNISYIFFFDAHISVLPQKH